MKATSEVRLRENFNAQQLQLDDEDMQAVDSIKTAVKYYQVRLDPGYLWAFSL